MPSYYTFTADLNSEKMLEIDVTIQFHGTEGWTSYQQVKGLIDTGASVSHISESVVPPDILSQYRHRIGRGSGASSTFESIWLGSTNIILPGQQSNGLAFTFNFPQIKSLNDSQATAERLSNYETIYHLFLGQDFLEKGELFLNGPESNYTLKFKMP